MSHARIPLLTADQMPGEVAEIERMLGVLPHSMGAYAYRPEIMAAFCELEMRVFETGTLPKVLKGAVAFATAQAHGSNYCMAHTGGMLIKNGMPIEALPIAGDGAALGDPRTAAAIRFAHLSAKGRMTDAEFEAAGEHFTPGELVELLCVVGLFSWTSHVHDALGLPIEEHYETLGAHRFVAEQTAA